MLIYLLTISIITYTKFGCIRYSRDRMGADSTKLPVITASFLKRSSTHHILTLHTSDTRSIDCDIVHANHNSLVSDSPTRHIRIISKHSSKSDEAVTRSYTRLLTGTSSSTVGRLNGLNFNNVCIVGRGNSGTRQRTSGRLGSGVKTSSKARGIIDLSGNACCHLAIRSLSGRRVSQDKLSGTNSDI